jgi:hypothetical protein
VIYLRQHYWNRDVTHVEERERLVQNLQRTIDGSVEPRMVSTRSKSDKIMLVSDVFLLGVVKWVVVRDVSLDAAVLLFCWTVHCQQ